MVYMIAFPNTERKATSCSFFQSDPSNKNVQAFSSLHLQQWHWIKNPSILVNLKMPGEWMWKYTPNIVHHRIFVTHHQIQFSCIPSRSIQYHHFPMLSWLVVGTPTPTWKMMDNSSVGMMKFPNMWKVMESHKSHVPVTTKQYPYHSMATTEVFSTALTLRALRCQPLRGSWPTERRAITVGQAMATTRSSHSHWNVIGVSIF